MDLWIRGVWTCGLVSCGFVEFVWIVCDDVCDVWTILLFEILYVSDEAGLKNLEPFLEVSHPGREL